jgi:hypothetical protein
VDVKLSIHSAAIYRFPQSLRAELDIPGKIQGAGPIVVINIDLDTFGLFCEYAYTGNYSVLETSLVSHNTSQTPRRLKEENARGFDGPFAVVLPSESRTLLHTPHPQASGKSKEGLGITFHLCFGLMIDSINPVTMTCAHVQPGVALTVISYLHYFCINDLGAASACVIMSICSGFLIITCAVICRY